MALFNILFGRLPGLTQKTIGFLPIDVNTEETITHESDVTEHPVETGGVIADHINTKPIGLRIRGTIRGQLKSLGYQALQTLHDRREPVFVVTGLQTYQNMAITSLVFPRDWRNAAALEFTAEFREVKFVSSAVTAAPPSKPAKSAKNTAAPTKNAGQTQATPVAPSPATTPPISPKPGSGGSFLSQVTGVGPQ